MKRFIRLFSTALLIAASVALVPATVSAAHDPFQNLECTRGGQGAGSAVCGVSAGNPVNDVLHKITNIVAVLAGAAAIIVIVAAGIRFITAGGNPEEVAKARRTIIFAAVGLIIIAVARFIINLIISGI
jgi:hypothetical protein